MPGKRLALMLLLVAGAALIAGGWFWLHRPVAINPSFRLPKIDRLVALKSERRLLAFANGKLVHSFEAIQLGDAPIGQKAFEGDEKTPEGIYLIDYRNPRSAYHLSLHISYPDARAKAIAAREGRSPGGDVFIHGQPNWLPAGRMRGDWTNGCIALSNDEIEALWLAVPDGTPIEIRP